MTLFYATPEHIRNLLRKIGAPKTADEATEQEIIDFAVDCGMEHVV